MTQLRTDLIKILSNLSDEPARTYVDLEIYILKRERAVLESFRISFNPTISESRAYSLYCAGKHSTEIVETLSDEFPELDGDQIDKIVNDAKERFEESKVRHEL